jgi:hypothetical protein
MLPQEKHSAQLQALLLQTHLTGWRWHVLQIGFFSSGMMNSPAYEKRGLGIQFMASPWLGLTVKARV